MVPIIRIILYLGLYWGHPILEENYIRYRGLSILGFRVFWETAKQPYVPTGTEGNFCYLQRLTFAAQEMMLT